MDDMCVATDSLCGVAVVSGWVGVGVGKREVLKVEFDVRDLGKKFKEMGHRSAWLSLLLSALLAAHARALRIDFVASRRTASLAACMLGAGLAGPRPSSCAAADEAPFTAMDAFQLRASYRGLDGALQGWNVEIASVQLGNEPSSVVAVAGLGQETLKRFAACGASEGVESFEKRRDKLLQFLYLARGAARYEDSPAVARDFIEKARTEAEAARNDLASISEVCGVKLSTSR